MQNVLTLVQAKGFVNWHHMPRSPRYPLSVGPYHVGKLIALDIPKLNICALRDVISQKFASVWGQVLSLIALHNVSERPPLMQEILLLNISAGSA